MKNKISLSIFFLSQIFLSFSQTQGIDFSIAEDSVILKLKKSKNELIRKKSIKVKIEIKNNTDSNIIFRKQTDIISTISLTGLLPQNFCDSLYFGWWFSKFLFTDENEPMQNIQYLPMDEAYYNKLGKIKIAKGSHSPNFRVHKRKSRRYSTYNMVNLFPNDSLMYNMNIYLGDYKLEKNKIYYLVIAYNNSNNELGLSKICLKSNRLKIFTE
jgi:hypothetical protein